jgi:hypothetical protein
VWKNKDLSRLELVDERDLFAGVTGENSVVIQPKIASLHFPYFLTGFLSFVLDDVSCSKSFKNLSFTTMVNYQQITKKNISHNPIYKQSNSDRPNPP